MGRTHNKDYYTERGSSGGPSGPLKQFKDELSQEKAVLRRDEEHRLPGEKPIAGKPKKKEQARAAHARDSVLDRLPKPVGAAGVPRSMKAVATSHEERHEEPTEFGVPASEDTALGGDREPFEREAGELRHVEREGEGRIPPIARRMIRTFPRAFRVLGDAAQAIDRPVKRTLETLQQLGREAGRQH